MTSAPSAFELLANHCVDAGAMTLDYQDLPPERRIAGAPRVGTAVLGQAGDRTVGVWEIEPSVSSDVEVDEFFVVLKGEAVVSFADGSPDLALRPGTVARLAAGAATTWAVTETLRKIYIA